MSSKIYKFKCPLCNTRAKNVYGIVQHFRFKHFRYPVNKCPLCGEEIGRGLSIYLHYLGKTLVGDLLHAFYYLCVTSVGRGKFRKYARELIEEKCKVK